jgi:S-DNA-T family DNA segregation ATPase FtsK/SpoIIIE
LKLKSELERRGSLLRTDRNALNKLPSIVCIIDEYHHLITDIDDKGERNSLDNALSGLIKRGRNMKIHMVFATQEPRKEFIRFGGVSNIQSRIALMCSDMHESMAAIGQKGAEKLVGKGAMLVKLPNSGMMYKNIQGAYMPEGDIEKLLDEIKKEMESNISDRYKLENMGMGTVQAQSGISPAESIHESATVGDIYDELLARAIIWTLGQDEVSNNGIKKLLGMGHAKANKVMEKLEQFDLITMKDIRKFKNPRHVKPKSLDELLQIPELVDILARNNLSETDIANAINKR